MSNEQKIYNLTVELLKVQKEKKAVVGGYNDEIKRIQGEIKEMIADDQKANKEEPSVS